MLLFLSGFFLGIILTAWGFWKVLNSISKDTTKGKQSVTIYKPERITEAKFIQQITQPKGYVNNETYN